MTKQKINNPTKKQIEKYLNVIGWSLRSRGCERYSFNNHKKRSTQMMLIFPDTDGRIEIDGTRNTPSVHFYLKEVSMRLLDNDCVCFSGIHDESIFILCQNHNKNHD